MSLLIILIFLILSICVTLGYGSLFTILYKIPNQTYLTGIFGIIFLTFISIFTSFFFPHNFSHNLFIFTLGIIFFIFYQIKKRNYSNFRFIIVILFLTFINLLIFKNHDDFPYYHFPYINYLNEFSLNLGIGQFNHGFRTPSSIFYFNSLFYLPVIKNYGFNIGVFLYSLFSNYYFLKKIYFDIQEKKIDNITYYNLVALVLINVFFYRIAEHGTDRSAQILILILISELFLFFRIKLANTKINHGNIFVIFFILILVVSLKAFYILYIILLIPIFYKLFANNRNKSNYKLFREIFLTREIIFCIFFLLLILLVYFINTGCFLYPLSFTCFSNVSWSIDKQTVDSMKNWYELWSKAGASPNFRVDNPEMYITEFNWVKNWVKDYFFNKVSDYVLGILFMIILFTAIFYNKKINVIEKNKFNLVLYFFIFILTVYWFYNHPALRYGGYILLFNILVIPFTFLFYSFYNIKNHKVEKIKIYSLIFLIFFVSLSRNINRINQEAQKYNYDIFENAFYHIDNNHYYRISDKVKLKKKNLKKCIVKNKDKKICNEKYKSEYYQHLDIMVFKK